MSSRKEDLRKATNDLGSVVCQHEVGPKPACRKCGTGGLGASATRSPNGEEGTRGAGDIKERKLNSLISGFEFPDKPLIIPCSIPSQDLALAAELTQIEAFTAANGRNEPIEFTKFPVFFPVSREFRGGEGFARDCILRQQVSTAEKLCSFPLKIAENLRNSACFVLKPDSEKVSCW
ncbi:MAG: hypothetical protein ABSC64_22705, partial [Candidatus Korobacteraceae bacterium]